MIEMTAVITAIIIRKMRPIPFLSQRLCLFKGLHNTHVSDNLAKGLKTVKATIEEGPGVDIVF